MNVYMKISFPALVSIVIRTYPGRLLHLKNAINSIIQQHEKNIEVIVVEDGGSTYNDFICKLGDRRFTHYGLPKVGRCVTGNFGLSLSTGRYISILDDDDYFYPNHIELLVNRIIGQKEVLAVYASSHIIKSRIELDEFGAVQSIKVSERKILFSNKYSLFALLTVNLFPVQSVLFDRSLYEMHGGFSTDMERLEDWDLWVKYSQYTDYDFVDAITSAFRLPMKSKSSSVRKSDIVAFHDKAISRFEKYARQGLSYYDAHLAIKGFEMPQIAK